jgi:hypothetical protein
MINRDIHPSCHELTVDVRTGPSPQQFVLAVAQEVKNQEQRGFG